MGLHTLTPTPDDTGLGKKVERLVHGFAGIKTAYELGRFGYDALGYAAPYMARAAGGAASIGRAALPFISAAL